MLVADSRQTDRHVGTTTLFPQFHCECSPSCDGSQSSDDAADDAADGGDGAGNSLILIIHNTNYNLYSLLQHQKVQ